MTIRFQLAAAACSLLLAMSIAAAQADEPTAPTLFDVRAAIGSDGRGPALAVDDRMLLVNVDARAAEPGKPAKVTGPGLDAPINGIYGAVPRPGYQYVQVDANLPGATASIAKADDALAATTGRPAIVVDHKQYIASEAGPIVRLPGIQHECVTARHSGWALLDAAGRLVGLIRSGAERRTGYKVADRAYTYPAKIDHPLHGELYLYVAANDLQPPTASAPSIASGQNRSARLPCNQLYPQPGSTLWYGCTMQQIYEVDAATFTVRVYNEKRQWDLDASSCTDMRRAGGDLLMLCADRLERWDLTVGQMKLRVKLIKPNRPAYSPDGAVCAVLTGVDDDQYVQFIDTVTGRTLATTEFSADAVRWSDTERCFLVEETIFPAMPNRNAPRWKAAYPVTATARRVHPFGLNASPVGPARIEYDDLQFAGGIDTWFKPQPRMSKPPAIPRGVDRFATIVGDFVYVIDTRTREALYRLPTTDLKRIIGTSSRRREAYWIAPDRVWVVDGSNLQQIPTSLMQAIKPDRLVRGVPEDVAVFEPGRPWKMTLEAVDEAASITLRVVEAPEGLTTDGLTLSMQTELPLPVGGVVKLQAVTADQRVQDIRFELRPTTYELTDTHAPHGGRIVNFAESRRWVVTDQRGLWFLGHPMDRHVPTLVAQSRPHFSIRRFGDKLAVLYQNPVRVEFYDPATAQQIGAVDIGPGKIKGYNGQNDQMLVINYLAEVPRFARVNPDMKHVEIFTAQRGEKPQTRKLTQGDVALDVTRFGATRDYHGGDTYPTEVLLYDMGRNMIASSHCAIKGGTTIYELRGFGANAVAVPKTFVLSPSFYDAKHRKFYLKNTFVTDVNFEHVVGGITKICEPYMLDEGRAYCIATRYLPNGFELIVLDGTTENIQQRTAADGRIIPCGDSLLVSRSGFNLASSTDTFSRASIGAYDGLRMIDLPRAPVNSP